MARVFNEWFLGLSGEEQRAFENEMHAREDALREEWEAEQQALREAEPELPFPPVPRPALEDLPF